MEPSSSSRCAAFAAALAKGGRVYRNKEAARYTQLALCLLEEERVRAVNF